MNLNMLNREQRLAAETLRFCFTGRTARTTPPRCTLPLVCTAAAAAAA